MNDQINKKWARIQKINKEVDDMYHKIALHYNLSDSAFWVIYVLYEADEPYTQKQICDTWYYNKQTINSAIKTLEKRGYIRKVETENKLNKKIILTKAGLELAEQSVKKVIEVENKAFSKVSEKELDTIIELLQKELDLLKKEAGKILK